MHNKLIHIIITLHANHKIITNKVKPNEPLCLSVSVSIAFPVTTLFCRTTTASSQYQWHFFNCTHSLVMKLLRQNCRIWIHLYFEEKLPKRNENANRYSAELNLAPNVCQHDDNHFSHSVRTLKSVRHSFDGRILFHVNSTSILNERLKFYANVCFMSGKK